MKSYVITKLIIFLLTLLLLFSCSCSNSDDTVSTSPSPNENESDTVNEDDITSYAKAGLNADDIIMIINGDEITAEEYFYCLDSSYEYMVNNYGEVTDWDAMATDDLTISEYLLQDALESCKSYHLFSTFGAEYGGNEITEEDQAEIDEYYNIYITEYFGSEENLLEALGDNISLDYFKFAFCETPVMYNKVFNAMFDSSDYMTVAGEDEVNAYLQSEIIDQGYIHVCQIFLKTVDDEGEPLSEGDIEDAYTKAQYILTRLNEGEDFFELMEQYSQDPGKEDYPNGYYINEDSGSDPQFFEAASALEENQYSDIVEGTYGYHIILRLPVQAEDFAEEVCWYQYDSILATWREQSTVEYTDLFDVVDPSTIYG